MPPSNMSIQTTAEPSYMDRPSMKEDDHPEHNMPAPEHDGTVLLKQGMANRSDVVNATTAAGWVGKAMRKNPLDK